MLKKLDRQFGHCFGGDTFGKTDRIGVANELRAKVFDSGYPKLALIKCDYSVA
jgi:hypothetical protein